MLVPILLFIVGLVLLIKGGDWFVDGATGLAHRFHVPEILIGATVVSIGTTLPEVMVSATSAVSGHGEIAYGNAIGSVICNTALDFKTDAALRKALKEETEEATTLIVAQRISTILHADRILVLDEGKVVGMGTHRELLQSCEVYRQIAQSQLSQEELDHE